MVESDYLKFALVIVLASAVCYLLWKGLIETGDIRRSQRLSTLDKAFAARERLISALLGDYKAADRLIQLEHRLAEPIGCGKLEAVERALSRLEKDRSRIN